MTDDRRAEGRDSTLPAAPPVDAEGGQALRACPLCGATYPSDFVVCPRDASPLGIARTDDDPLLGQVLAGTYRVTGVLGEGGMGRLYEAEHLRLDRRVALKVIHEGWAQRADLLARFEREARVLGRVRSPHVVQVLDVLQTADGRPCIVCERLEGEDLEARLAREPRLGVAEAIGIARQACAGLASAHAVGVVHRDLKPSNLFLVEDGTVKVLDFGVARLADADDGARLTRTGAVVGTPAYMAPEQARGAAGVDARSDVYAVGAVLYRMLTGHAPYAGPDAATTLAAVLEREPARPRALERSIPEGVELLVQTAMARDPAARPASVGALAVSLAAFAPGAVAGQPGDGRASSTPEGAAEAVTRAARLARPLAVCGVAAAALAAGAATASALGLVVASLRGQARVDATDVALVTLAGLVALVATAFAAGRTLRDAWTSTPRAARFAATSARALLAGAATFGALELAARLGALRALEPAGVEPLWAVARLAIAAAAALVALRMAPRAPR